MEYIKKSDTNSYSYYQDAVNVTEFTFPNNFSVNDAEIYIHGRYPIAGYAVNDLSTAFVSIESGSGSITIKGSEPQELAEGDRLLIKPGEPYSFDALGTLAIRYIAIPAWHPSQSRIIED